VVIHYEEALYQVYAPLHFYPSVSVLSHYVTSHPGQLSLAIPLWVGVMSTRNGYDHR